MFLLLLFICIVFLRKVNKHSLAFFFTLIVVISLVGNLFIKENYVIDLSDILHFFWILLVLGLIITPWKSYHSIKEVKCVNPKRLKFVTICLVVFCLIMLVGCAVLAYFTITMIEDVNLFKYKDGPTEFYYSLGIDLRPFMFATLFYPLSYIMIPLHLYYLSKGEKWLSFWCFIASLLSIVYGMTYFSRAHLIHYIVIYLGSFWLLRDILSRSQKDIIKKVMYIGTFVVIAYFLSISITRFDEHDYETHSGVVVSNNAVINSMFDYLVMWWNNSETLLSRFDWSTFHGQIAFQDINRLLGMFGIQVGAVGELLMKQRELILGEYAGSFIGVGEYFLYDFGPLISVLILLLYYVIINNLRPRRSVITIERLIIISILALLPSFAIFYSVLNVILLEFIFVTPIIIFLKSK